jgi:competence ComEA-like helix-hairpin-helix protein
VSLNSATFEQLRGEGLSVTQATRVLAYRERLGGYSSVDDLDDVPGFPEEFLADLKHRVTV